MKLIVPMAGRGTRLRPHTHVTPKPLLPVAGRPMVERIVETLAGTVPDGFEEVVFILGPDFGQAVRDSLSEIAERLGTRASFAVQETAEGTAHAVIQAEAALSGPVVVAFADTLFYMDGTAADFASDAVIWTKTVEDPRAYGVAVKDGDRITRFVEKPDTPISNEAIIGIYYFREGERLAAEIRKIMDADQRGRGGEFQLTDALDALLNAGARFTTASVDEWLDCGTIPDLKATSRIVLAKDGEHDKRGSVEDSQIIEPVFLGEGATVRGSVVGPFAAIHAGATVEGSVVKNTIVFGDAEIAGSALDGAVIGHSARVAGVAGELNIGDHATAGAVDA